MSAVALLQAVEARLRDVLSDPEGKVCGVQDGPHPPPFAGQVYHAIHWAGCKGDDPNSLSTDKLHDVTVTLTWRMGYSPKDRRGARILASGELLEKAEFVADSLHMDYVSMNAANQLISGFGTTTSGFVEPLKLGSIGTPQPVGPEWVGASDGADLLVVPVMMVGARRVTTL